MTKSDKPLESDGLDAAPRPQESASEKTLAEQTADKKRKHKSEHAETQNPDQKQSDRDEPIAESSWESEEGPKPFDFGGLPDRNLKKNLGCG